MRIRGRGATAASQLDLGLSYCEFYVHIILKNGIISPILRYNQKDALYGDWKTCMECRGVKLLHVSGNLRNFPQRFISFYSLHTFS